MTKPKNIATTSATAVEHNPSQATINDDGSLQLPSRFSPEVHEKHRESMKHLMDHSNVTEGTEDWHAKFGYKSGTITNGEAGGAEGAAYRPDTSQNPVAVAHREFMVSGGRKAMALGPHATSETIAHIISKSCSDMLAERTVEVIGGDNGETLTRYNISTGIDPETAEVITRTVGVRTVDIPGVSREEVEDMRQSATLDMLLNLDLSTYGRSEVAAIDKYAAMLTEVSHFDTRSGKPALRYTGKVREGIERNLYNAQKSLRLAQLTAAAAAQAKTEYADLQAEQRVEDETAIDEMANKIYIEDEARKRAAQIAMQRRR